METLSTKVLNSLGWIFTNIAARNLLQLFRMWILWKLLAPADFGLNGLAWLAINMFTLLQDMGFSAALIQRKTDLQAAISVTWYTNVVIRVVVYAILFLVAPLVAEHFHEPELSSILRIASLCILFSSFGNANETILRKNFQFKRILVVETLELIVQCVVQIALAALGFGVWSLVYGSIASTLSKSALLWWLAPIRVGRFDPAVAKDMFHFAKHMTLSTLFIWLILHMDNYFVGKYMGAAALGYYTLAFSLAHLIATNVGRLLGSVLFPAFSEIGGDRDRVRAAWLRAARYSMVVLVPMTVGLIVFSPEIVLGLFRRKCEVIIAPVAILAVFALCRGLGTTLGDLAKGIGKPGILSRIAFWHVVLMAPLLWAAASAVQPGLDWAIAQALRERAALEAAIARVFLLPEATRFGLIAVSLVVSGTSFFAMGLSFLLLSREVMFTAREVVHALRPPIVAGLLMAASGWAGKELFETASGAPPLVLLVIFGTLSSVVYFAALRLLFPEVFSHLRGLLERRKGEMKARALEKAAARPAEIGSKA